MNQNEHSVDRPHIKCVVAYSRNRVIGKDNTLPWHLPADLQHFKKNTLGQPIIMGRKTWQSLGRPLAPSGQRRITASSARAPEIFLAALVSLAGILLQSIDSALRPPIGECCAARLGILQQSVGLFDWIED